MKKKTEIASKYHCSCRAIYNTIQRWNDHETVNSLPRSGAPEKLTRYQKRLVLRIVRKHPRIEYAALKCEAAGVNISHRTLQRFLSKFHITKWLAKKRPKLTPAVARKRLRWAQKFKGFPWTRVKFSDECSYKRGAGKKPAWVFRVSLEKWDHDKIEEVSLGKALTQMIYAVFWYDGRSELIAMERDPLARKHGYGLVVASPRCRPPCSAAA